MKDSRNKEGKRTVRGRYAALLVKQESEEQ